MPAASDSYTLAYWLDGQPYVRIGVDLAASTGLAYWDDGVPSTVIPGTSIVTVASIASAEAVGTVTIVPGAITVAPTGIPGAEAFGTPAVGIQTVSLTGIASSEILGTATVTPGTTVIAATGIASSEAFGTVTMDAQAARGALAYWLDGQPWVGIGATAASRGLLHWADGGPHAVIAEQLLVVLVGIPSGEAFGTVTLTSYYSPADIVRWLLVGMGHGTDPASASTWPIYVSSEPTTPDNCITVYDTTGRATGREMTAGSRAEYHGIQLRIRASNHTTGYGKARRLANILDRDVYQAPVVIGGQHYVVQQVGRVGTITTMGKDAPGSKRSLFSINALVTILQPDGY